MEAQSTPDVPDERVDGVEDVSCLVWSLALHA